VGLYGSVHDRHLECYPSGVIDGEAANMVKEGKVTLKEFKIRED
jgi:hypothetical protein